MSLELEIYEEQKKGGRKEHPFNYMPPDIVTRLPWWAGEPEPPLRVLYPRLLETRHGTIIDPLTIRIGWTVSGKPFAYNPRYVVNPLVLIVGTPGAGKSLHPGEKVLVVRGGRAMSVPIHEVKPGDYTFSVTRDRTVYLAPVLDVIRHEYRGPLYRIEYVGPEGPGVVRVTPDHSLLLYASLDRIEPVRADQVSRGDDLPMLWLGGGGAGEFVVPVIVTRVTTEYYEGPVYDLATKYGTFALEDGLLVHNSATMKTFILNLLENMLFLEEGRRPPPVIVVDPEGEYHVLGQYLGKGEMLHLRLGRKEYINIFDRPSTAIHPLHWYMRMLSVLEKFMSLSREQGPLAYLVLVSAINELVKERGFTDDPATWSKPDITLADIYNHVYNLKQAIESSTGKLKMSDRQKYRGATTLITRLQSWMYPPNDAFSRPSTIPLREMFRYRLVILDTAGLAKVLQGLFAYWITFWTYALMLERGPLPSFGLRMILVIDEAWSLLNVKSSKEESPLEEMARRARKYGIGIVVGTQTPDDVSEKMFSLFGTLVTGVIPSQKMREKIARSRSMPKGYADLIGHLSQGRLLWSINWRKRDFPMHATPILVKTDYPIKELIQVVID